MDTVLLALKTQRQSGHDEIARRFQGPSHGEKEFLIGSCKKSAVETIYLEGTIEVMTEYHEGKNDAWKEIKELSAFFDLALDLSLHWISFNWSPITESDRVSQEILTTRKCLLDACSRLIGAMSLIDFGKVIDALVRILGDRVVPKRESKPNYDLLRLQVSVAYLEATAHLQILPHPPPLFFTSDPNPLPPLPPQRHPLFCFRQGHYGRHRPPYKVQALGFRRPC